MPQTVLDVQDIEMFKYATISVSIFSGGA